MIGVEEILAAVRGIAIDVDLSEWMRRGRGSEGGRTISPDADRTVTFSVWQRGCVSR